MRSEREASAVAKLTAENERLRRLAIALWAALDAYNRGPFLVVVDAPPSHHHDEMFRAIDIIHARHFIVVTPCRRILDPLTGPSWNAWPTQDEAYLGRWPDGSIRNLTRDQVLMMAGIVVDRAPAQQPLDDVPF